VVLKKSPWAVYDLVRRKVLPAARFGRTIRIPRRVIAQLAGQEAEAERKSR
jgi:excisionase family DNA binding protein